MAEVLLFHHALGPTEGVEAFANDLREAGHAVHTPDLFEGRTFDSIEAGLGYVHEIGWGELMARGTGEDVRMRRHCLAQTVAAGKRERARERGERHESSHPVS